MNETIQNLKFILISLLTVVTISNASATSDIDTSLVVIENAEMRLILSSQAKAISLLHKPTGQECLDTTAEESAVFEITEYRPHDNERFLIYPAKTTSHAANRVKREGDNLIVGFDHLSYTATIALTITEYYIGFQLIELEYDIEKFGIKRPTEIDEFTLLQLPIKKRDRFGEWLNVAWDNDIAVNILATDQYTKIDAAQRANHHLMYAGIETEVKLMDVGAALITTNTNNLLNCIDQLERDYNLPLGVESRRNPDYPRSYYELRNATTRNIDRHIAYAKEGGFKIMVIYYPDFATSMGHFVWNEQKFPNKMADLQEITSKIKEAGMIPGFHIHYNKAAKNDPYVSPIPDSRLNLPKHFTLSDSIDATTTTIVVEENPRNCPMEDGRRFLKLGNELISYTDYTTTRPYTFNGCKRGELNSTAQSAEKGYKFGLLDVDTWPLFIRFDQRTSIQDEVGQRIGDIYAKAGFQFIYFDGAEDVHPPYWYNTSKAQLEVYKHLNPKPLFSEGAMKSHFSWHIITRGNAFDLFPPKYIRDATIKYPMPAAEYMADNFTSINFGWNDYLAPNSESDGMQPDMYEYICSRATAWNCPIALMGKLDQLDAHPRTSDNLEVVKTWEDARAAGFFTEEEREELKNVDQEHILLKNEVNEYELIPYNKVENIANDSPHVQAFMFSRNNKIWVVYWHTRDEAQLEIAVSHKKAALFEAPGKPIPFVKQSKASCTIPVGKRRYLVLDMSQKEALSLLAESHLNK